MRHHKVAQLVSNAYTSSKQDFAQWIWENHLQLVTQKAEALSKRFGAKEDLAVAGAWLHDLGDAFVHRHSDQHTTISISESKKILQEAGYSDQEIDEVLVVIIEPHSCKEGKLPRTLEGKVLATADALAHLTTDFYLQFAWKHLPEDKSYQEFVHWVHEKLDRDFNQKIFFAEVREEVRNRYTSYLEVFGKTNHQ
jgi:HD superfamily phosphodiesterase